jgi:hypothetical protein
VVKAGAGYGKLGYTSAPIEVNNGGITDFNGTDDDPTDPDTDDPDDPVIVDDGSAHTYTLSMQNKALVQTKDGVSGASYFDASTSVADFSKDYSSASLTIGDASYTQGIKMDSKGYVTFTTSATYNTSLEFYAVTRKSSTTNAKMQLISDGIDPIVFDVTPWSEPLHGSVQTLEKGRTYTLKQKESEQAVIIVIVKETE